MDIEVLKKTVEDNKGDIINRVKILSEGGEDLKPDKEDKVLLEDNDEIQVYMNTWKNYNEYGADLVLYDNIDGWMSIDDAIEFCEKYADDEPFINDTENVPMEVSEYDSPLKVLNELKALEDFDEEKRDVLELILSTGDFDFDQAVEIVEDDLYDFYPDATSEFDLGYALVDRAGSIEDVVDKDLWYAYINVEQLRDSLEYDIDNMLYDTAKDEVEYEHRFDDPDSYDEDEEIEKWIDDHRYEELDAEVDSILEGDIDEETLENFFDFEAFGRDYSINNHIYFTDKGALEILHR